MNIQRFPLPWVLTLTAVLGGGCLKLKPRPDNTRFYVLASPEAVAEHPSSSDADALPVYLGRVEIPEYLQTTAIATRLGETEIYFSDEHRWAEPLREGATRLLRDALAVHYGPDRVQPTMFRRPGGAYLEAQVALTRFECETGGLAVAIARWNLLRQPGSQPAAAGESVVRHHYPANPDDYRPAVAALSLCLADLGREIAQQCTEHSMP